MAFSQSAADAMSASLRASRPVGGSRWDPSQDLPQPKDRRPGSMILPPLRFQELHGGDRGPQWYRELHDERPRKMLRKEPVKALSGLESKDVSVRRWTLDCFESCMTETVATMIAAHGEQRVPRSFEAEEALISALEYLGSLGGVGSTGKLKAYLGSLRLQMWALVECGCEGEDTAQMEVLARVFDRLCRLSICLKDDCLADFPLSKVIRSGQFSYKARSILLRSVVFLSSSRTFTQDIFLTDLLASDRDDGVITRQVRGWLPFVLENARLSGIKRSHPTETHLMGQDKYQQPGSVFRALALVLEAMPEARYD